MFINWNLPSVVRQRPVSDVGGLVLRHDLHEPGPDHGALPCGVSAPQVQGALQGLWQKSSTFIRFQASVKPRRILPGEKLGENTIFLTTPVHFSQEKS